MGKLYCNVMKEEVLYMISKISKGKIYIQFFKISYMIFKVYILAQPQSYLEGQHSGELKRMES